MTALLEDTGAWEITAEDRRAAKAMTKRLGLYAPKLVRLPTLIRYAELMERTDRKYIVPIDAARELIETIGDTHRVLGIDGRRHTTYRTLYFDTADLTSARAHIQRRRHRWKVRSRLYVEDQLSRVEVKTKDNRGNTTKVMDVSDPHAFGRLTGDDLNFVSLHLDRFPDADVHALRPSAEVCYTRATLADLSAGTRVTVDWSLSMHLSHGDVWLDEGHVMIETKGPAALSRVDKTMHSLGLRPRGFSKYVSAASTVHARLPSNDFASLRANAILHSRTWEA